MGWTGIGWHKGSKLRDVIRKELECDGENGKYPKWTCLQDTIRNRRDYYGIYNITRGEMVTTVMVICLTQLSKVRGGWDHWLRSTHELRYKEMTVDMGPYSFDVPLPMFQEYERLVPVPRTQYEADWRTTVRIKLGLPDVSYQVESEAA